MIYYETSNELYHYGVLGMKWGVRRTPEQLGHPTRKSKKKTPSKGLTSFFSKRKKTTSKKSTKIKVKQTNTKKKKSVSEMSDDELRRAINRLQMEKQYKDLLPKETSKTSKGKAFVADVLERSGKNIATQAVTYGMGKAVNTMFKDIAGEDIVNPKKGQKDK